MEVALIKKFRSVGKRTLPIKNRYALYVLYCSNVTVTLLIIRITFFKVSCWGQEFVQSFSEIQSEQAELPGYHRQN